MGDLDEAARAARQALASARRAGPDRPGSVRPVAEIILVLARIERERDDYVSSDTWFASALGLLEPTAERRLLARALVGVGGGHRRAGRYPQAVGVLDRAVAVAETVAAVDSHPLVAALTERGITAKEIGDHHRAADLYAWVQEIHRDHGASPADAATLEHNLSGLEYSKGCYPVAELHARRALERRRGDPRVTEVDLASDLAVLAATVAAQHRYDEARAMFEQTLSVYRAARSPRRYEIAVQVHGLADIEHSAGHPERAEQRYREALAIKQDLLGPEHPEVGLVTANLGALLAEQHREAEAAECYRQALVIAERTFGRQHPRSLRLLANALRTADREEP